jgi:tetratricopeptide (TPR) repeat protein
MSIRSSRFLFVLSLFSLLAAVWPSWSASSGHGPGQSSPQALAQQDSLKPDARVGAVLDRQGLVFVRPVARARWTPLEPKDLLFPGDLVRCGPRGANAAELSLQAGGTLLLGPGAMVELREGGAVKLYSGEVELKPAAAKEGEAAQAIPVTGPRGFRAELRERAVYRVHDHDVAKLDKDPRWVTGYRASSTDEWMGSLLAKVDGRDVPLSVGYHKVDVVIRDQIAQTTVEQSFVNSTKERLEGVFYFPLPADASISGFGMWIGGELVNADIVEKSRARQIFEDLMRRKKDPGLLEWSGGNLFKARVWPIEAHSEKRVRIRYTQVLPLEGQSYRYRYALRSELLRTRPLRELALKVSVESATPIQEISSATHSMRVRKQEHVAQAEFEAQEYSPDRDFELRVDLEAAQPLTSVAHRRGDDGYFMLLLSPPDERGAGWQRELVPEGDALRLILYADTSASMEESARATQREFLRALLSQLGPDDRFHLAACDVQVVGYSEDAIAATPENVAKAMDWLEQRPSLGWSDLDAMLQHAVLEAKAGTQVIYVGDGIGTTGNASPAELAARFAGRSGETKASFHAVSTSASYEKLVLDAIAGIGGGSVRSAVDRELGTARDLLAEIAQPAIKDLELRFEGMRTARVYPERLPNLAAGTPQVVLGRYLPGAEEQRGRVTLTGIRNGKPLQFSSELVLPAGDAGNSFLPRLWARRHLDFLLTQGGNAEIQEEIVGFSAEFGIMTPYTSFLVLESDEDRERYGVERRVAMRDGEKFFTEAKDRVELEMLREQMKVAQGWRMDLRRRFLSELARLGRDLVPAQIAVAEVLPKTNAGVWNDAIGLGGGAGGGLRTTTAHGGGGAYRGPSDAMPMAPMTGAPMAPGAPEMMDRGRMEQGGARGGRFAGRKSEAKSGDEAMNLDMEVEEELAEIAADPSAAPEPVLSPGGPTTPGPMARRSRAPRLKSAPEELARGRMQGFLSEKNVAADSRMDRFADEYGYSAGLAGKKVIAGLEYAGRPGRRIPTQWRNWMLFPGLGKAPTPLPAYEEPSWDPRILSMLRSLDRREAIAQMPGLLQLRLRGGAVHEARKQHDIAWQIDALLGASQYYLVRTAPKSDPLAEWILSGERGVLSLGYGLGRKRAAAAHEWALMPLQLSDGSLDDLVRIFGKWSARIESEKEGVVTLRLRAPAPSQVSQVWKIDVERKAILSRAFYSREELQGSLRMLEHVEVAGRHWPARIERLDRDGKVQRRVTLEIEGLDADAAKKAIAARLDAHPDAVMLPAEMPELGDAQQALFEKKASPSDHLRLAMHYGSSQQWNQVWEHFEAFAKFASPQSVSELPGLDWMRLELLLASRRAEEFLQLFGKLRDAVLPERGAVAQFRAERLRLKAERQQSPMERLELAEQIAPIFASEGPFRDTLHKFIQQHRISLLRGLHRAKDAQRIVEALSKEYPLDAQIQILHMSVLFELGSVREAIAFNEAVLERDWDFDERESLWGALTSHLFQWRRLNELHAALQTWVAEEPMSPTAYVRDISVRFYRDELEIADEWILSTLSKGLSADPSRLEQARLQAAVTLALGRGWGWSADYVLEAWRPALQKIALDLCMREELRHDFTGTIVGNRLFRRTDEYKATRSALLDRLQAEGSIEQLSLQQLERFVSWLDWRSAGMSDAVFAGLRARMHERWTKIEDLTDRSRIAKLILQVLDQRGDKDAAIAFLRERLGRAKADYAAHIASMLLPRLVSRYAKDWSQEIEDEIAMLVPLTITAEPSDDPLRTELRKQQSAKRARWLADKLWGMRLAKEMGPVKDYEKLPRAELKLHRSSATDRARLGLATRLMAEAEKQSEPYATWLRVESLTFSVERGKDLGDPVQLLTQALRNLPAPVKTDEDEAADEALELSNRIFRERVATLLSYASLRRGAPEGLADDVLALLRDMDAKQPGSANWKQQIFRLLVVLDRVDELERDLARFIDPDQVDPTWRVALAWLRAELGELRGAVQLFEEAAGHDSLSAAQYATLAKWYLVLNEDEQRLQTIERQYHKTNEWTLAGMIQSEYYRLRRKDSGVMKTLEPEVLIAARVLFDKSSNPASHIWRIRNLYNQTKDYRVLAPIAGGLTGNTPAATYRFLQNMQSIIGSVHEEATLDPFHELLTQKIATAKTPMDRRALHLMQSLVFARAAKVLNQPQAYAERALAAMRAAWPGGYASGEELELGQFLSRLGKLLPDVDRERMRALKALYEHFEGDPYQRLQLAGYYGRALDSQGGTADAVEVLRQELQRYAAPMNGCCDRRSGGHVDMLLGWMQKLGRYRAAERLVQKQLSLQQNIEDYMGWDERLWGIGLNALRKGALLELGQGEALYLELDKRIRARLLEAPARLSRTLNWLENIQKAAVQNARVVRAREDALRFGRAQFAELLPLAMTSGRNLISSYANSLKEIAGPEHGLEFALTRIEQQPRWYERVGVNLESRLDYNLARWRSESRGLDVALESRLLKLVLGELEKELERGGYRMNAFYWKNQRYFWRAKSSDFANVAGRVLELRGDSVSISQRIANYYWRGLGRRQSAIDAMRAVHSRGKLDRGGRWTLVQWLQQTGNYAESLTLLEGLLLEDALNLNYRGHKVTALFKMGRRDEAIAYLDASQKLFKEKKRWNESHIAFLASRCHAAELWSRAAALYEELIPLHQRTHRNRGIGRGTLSSYYTKLADACIGLKRWDDAVDAASAAVVSWGRTNSNRKKAISKLRNVLRALPDLETFVIARDAAFQESGEASPLLRKLLGEVYASRRMPKKAAAQLEIAVELQPGDAELWSLLRQAYEAAGDAQAVRALLLRQARQFPYQLETFELLGQWIAKAGDQPELELRAWTSLAELRPNEPEGHKKLAQYWAREGKHAEAVTQWQQVVRTQDEDPGGWFALVRAQRKAGQDDAARATLQQMLTRKWDERFGDVPARAAAELGR